MLRRNQKPHNAEIMSKGHKICIRISMLIESFQWPKLEQREQQNKDSSIELKLEF